MSSSSRRARQHIDAQYVIDLQQQVDAWRPDWGAVCRLCGETPCVTGVRAGQVVYASHLCGVCTFGDSDCADPDQW